MTSSLIFIHCFFPLIISRIIFTVSIFVLSLCLPRRHSISFQTRKRLKVRAYFILRKIFPLIGNLIYIQSNQFKLYASVFVFHFRLYSNRRHESDNKRANQRNQFQSYFINSNSSEWSPYFTAAYTQRQQQQQQRVCDAIRWRSK